MTSFEIFFCFLLISFSAFLSSTEIALFSLSRFQLRAMREAVPNAYKIIRKLISDPSGVLVTILFFNEIANVSITSLVTQAFAAGTNFRSPFWQTMGGIVFSAPIVLILCEVTPKTTGAQMNQVIAPLFSPLLFVFYRIALPIRWIAERMIRVFSKSGGSPASHQQKLGEDDFMILLEEGRKEGMIHQDELDLIRNVFQLNDTKVVEIATPISSVYTVSANSRIADVAPIIQRKRYTRVPVFGNSRKDVVGILYSKDIIFSRSKAGYQNLVASVIMREPLYVPDSMRVKTLFKRLRENQIHMAVVQNTTGEAVGVVTMKDILDEIFEDLFPDKHDVKREVVPT